MAGLCIIQNTLQSMKLTVRPVYAGHTTPLDAFRRIQWMENGQIGENGLNVTRLVAEVKNPEQEVAIILNPDVVEKLALVMIINFAVAMNRNVSQLVVPMNSITQIHIVNLLVRVSPLM